MEKVGEVIEACTTDYVAQCYELYKTPSLGTLVKAGDLPVYGIVASAATESIDPGRRPIARGKDEPSEEGIYRTSPQLMRLLRSEFSVLAIGYRQGNKIYHYLPPQPVPIHSFVHILTPEEIKDFSSSLGFLPVLLKNNRFQVDAGELTGAAIREMSRVQDDPHAFLVAAGKELAQLLRGNYITLKTVLGRLK